MRIPQVFPRPPRSSRHKIVARSLAAAALAMLAIAPVGSALTSARTVKVDSTMFAAQVGSTTTGSSVFAGAVPDRFLGHGAIVFSTVGTQRLRVTFQEFFSLGSIKGNGAVQLGRDSTANASFAGALRVTGGTGEYRGAHGSLKASGTLASDGTVQATLKGSFVR
jgi:hypothetical protein